MIQNMSIGLVGVGRFISGTDTGKSDCPMVGESPAEAAVREGWEETGVRSQPVGLVGIFDSLTHNRQGPHHLYQIVFLCRPINHKNPDPPHHPEETIEQGWFSEDALPPDLDPNHMLRIPKAFAYLNKQESVFE